MIDARPRDLKTTGAPGEIRTPGLLLRRQPLYPAELRAHSDGTQIGYHFCLSTRSAASRGSASVYGNLLPLSF